MLFGRRSVVLLTLTGLVFSSPPSREPRKAPGKQPTSQINNTADYDYVVVGSGPGGGPLASRLAIAGYKVLLIEAGSDDGNATSSIVPALNLQSVENPAQEWDYFVSHYADQSRQQRDSKMVWKQPNGSKYVGKRPPAGSQPLGIYYPRAGTLGGCAQHNAMIAIKPFDSDWEYVRQLTSDESWAPDNMQTYFEKLERCEYLPNSVTGHGFDGWLTTSLTSLALVVEDTKLISLVLSAATALGMGLLTSLLSTVTGLAHVLLEDINSPEPIDTNVYQVPITVDPVHSTRSGPRDFIMSTVNAVNADGSRKYQLDIQLNTLATRIRFDRSASTPRAIGVEFVQGTSLYSADPRYTGAIGTAGYVAAKKEVIISAGAFNTPQLLKLSGVGPREELSKFGIEVVKDLPGVGTNLQDRYEVGVIGKSNRGGFVVKKGCTFGYTSPDPCLRDWQTGQSVAARGAYGSSGFAVAVPRRSSTLASNDDPDTFVFGTPVKFAGYYPGFARDAVNVNGYWSWLTLKARSHNNAGTVMLRSTNPRDTPLITFNYFDTGNTADDGDEKDLQASYEAIMFARKMYSDVIPLDGSFTEIIPGKRVQTEAQVKQWIKDEAWGHHASCTCPIGADNDPMAVLDSEFRVRGVDALRVVDASVFPKIPGFFISVPIYMVSEKAAAVIIGTQ